MVVFQQDTKYSHLPSLPESVLRTASALESVNHHPAFALILNHASRNFGTAGCSWTLVRSQTRFKLDCRPAG